MTESRQNNKSMLFIGGMLIGAVVAALFSPRSGEEMRKEVKDKAKDMKDKLESKKQEIKGKKDQAVDVAEDNLREAQSSTRGSSREKSSSATGNL
jgi:gas vesicle protein